MMGLLAPLFARLFAHPAGVLGWLGGALMARENRRMARRAVQLLDVRPGDRVLEVGFGPGVGIEILATRSPARWIAGIDPSPEMCEQASARNAMHIAAGTVSLGCSTVGRLPFADAAFDRAVAIRSLQLWPDADVGLREIRRVLVPGGRFVVAVTRQSGQTPDRLAAVLAAAGFDGARVVDVHGRLYASAEKPCGSGRAAA